MIHHIFDAPPRRTLGRGQRIFLGGALLLFTLLGAALLWLLLTQVAEAAPLPQPVAAKTQLLADAADRMESFESAMAVYNTALDTALAYQHTLWREYQLGRLSQDEWSGACSLANQVAESGFQVLAAALDHLGCAASAAAAGDVPETNSRLADEVRHAVLLVAAFLDYIDTLKLGEEILPWQRTR